MSRGVLTRLFSFFILTATSSAVTVDSQQIDRADLHLSPATETVAIRGWETVRLPDSPELPVRSTIFFFRQRPSRKDFHLNILVSDTINLGFAPAAAPPDTPTSDYLETIENRPQLFVPHSADPSELLHLTVAKRDDIFTAILVFFPLVYTDDSTIVFIRQWQIDIAEDLETSRLDEKPPFDRTVKGPDRGEAKLTSGQSTGVPLGGDFVVVTSPELAPAFSEFIRLKRQTGFDPILALTDSIYDRYPARDNPEAIRFYLRDFHASGGVYALLGGDENQVPIRYAYHYNTSEQPEPYDLIPCDMYYGEFDGEWEKDGDGVWGEPTEDAPDLGPELLVGRLPFRSAEQVVSYTAKFRTYLFDPGGGKTGYLNRAVFFTSDQMRDYFEGGQQYKVAEEFPPTFATECERLAEHPNGYDPAPTGPFAGEAQDELAAGYGMVNIISHGRPDGFVVSSSGYNFSPKTYLFTGFEDDSFTLLEGSGKPNLYYSIACDLGGFDLDSPPFTYTAPCIAERLLSLDAGSAVGMIAFARWGWVGSSYKLMAAFYRHLFNDTAGNPVEAMYMSWADYPYYRDQIYGQNYYGDPSLTVYTGLPDRIAIIARSTSDNPARVSISVTKNGSPLPNTPVTVSSADSIVAGVVCDAYGEAIVYLDSVQRAEATFTAFVPGSVSGQSGLTPSIAADAGDDEPVPYRFGLEQNFPNPFNPSTTIRFSLDKSGPAVLRIYDILGRQVCSIIEDYLAAGIHEVVWNGRTDGGTTVASGIYFYRLESSDNTLSKKMLMLK
jgi:hypothetical protein